MFGRIWNKICYFYKKLFMSHKHDDEDVNININIINEPEHHGHHHHDHKHRYQLILTTIINNFKIQIMATSLAANQKTLGALGLQDKVTSALVTATFSGTSAASDNDGVATASVDSDGNIVVIGVAAGDCNVSITSTANFTNSLGQPATSTQTISVAVHVDAVVTADDVQLIVTFGSPIPQ